MITSKLISYQYLDEFNSKSNHVIYNVKFLESKH